jgi:tetratricopeptide (TPR) repeat protein
VEDDLVAARLLDPKTKPNVREAVRQAIEVAKTRDPEGAVRKVREDLARLAASVKSRRRPQEMMPLWLLMLEQNRTRTELAEQAEKDSASLQAERDATPVQKGQAQIVRGLALRNTEKFAEARTALEAGRSAVDQADWLAAADAALREVSDPAAYFANQAESLYNRGRMDDALALLERALKLLPAKEQGRLLARRSLIELDAARTKVGGLIPPTQPMLVAARRDADAAVKAGAAEGHYAAGRIAEELGQPDAAIQSYRQALAAHSAMDAEGSRYRVALARVLSQPREVRRGPAVPPPAANKVGWIDPAPYPARYRRDVKLLILASVFGLEAPGLVDDQPGMEEAEKLADEVLKAPADKVPFDVRAQALAVKGRWTLALQTYVEGLRPLMPRQYGSGLVYLIANHPRLKRPDSLRIANPMEAEKHFAAGLNFYFERDYANAEKEFLLTVENDSNDARYFYYLGLSRLAQNKRRDAQDDFDQGATLERLNRPAPAAVSESLERIQGPTRRIVNDIRYRPER